MCLWAPLGARHPILAVLTLAGVTLASYATSFRAGFTLDNFHLILRDPRVHEASRENLRLIFTQDYWASEFVTGVYRPLTTLSFLFNYAVLGNGENPIGYHVLNLSFHLVNAVLVWMLALTVLERPRLALFTAAVFAAHPLATEAVTNIVGRGDLLAAMAVLVGLLCHLEAARSAGRRRVAALAGVATALGLGLLAKESAIALVGAMLVVDLSHRMEWSPAGLRRWLTGALPDYAVLLPPLLIVWYLRSRVYAADAPIRDVPFLENPLAGADFWTARLTALKVLGRYAALLVWPRSLSCDYSFDAIPVVEWPLEGWQDWQAIVALAGLITALAFTYRLRRRHPGGFFCLAFLLATLLPASNLIVPITTVMAERLAYLPLVGFAGCLVLAVARLCDRAPLPQPAFTTSVLALIVVALGARSFARNLDWKDNLTLFGSAVRAVPGSYKAHMAFAASLATQADAKTQSIDLIISEAERATDIVEQARLPIHARPLSLPLALADYYTTKAEAVGRDPSQSRRWHEWAARVLEGSVATGRAKIQDMGARGWPPDGKELSQARALTANSLFALGNTYIQLADYDDAAVAFDGSRRLAPDDTEAYLGLALVSAEAGQLEKAAVTAIQLLALDGSLQEGWRLLAQVYAHLQPGGCGIRNEAGRPQLDPACPMVRTQSCAAYEELARLFLDARQGERARQIGERAVAEQCARAPFEALLSRTPRDGNEQASSP